MHLVKLIRTASPEANLLAVLSAAALFIKITYLNTIPQIFPQAHELGVIIEAILASVVASYIFYIIVIHIKEQKDRAAIRPYISKHINRIIFNCTSQLQAFEKASGISLNPDSLKKEPLTKALSEIHPYSEAPLTLTSTNESANWIQYLSYKMNHAKNSTKRLLDQLIFLDVELVALITAIDDCHLYTSVEFFQKITLSNENLASISESFYKYFILCQSLKKYADPLANMD
jgi:hypothetical protein